MCQIYPNLNLNWFLNLISKPSVNNLNCPHFFKMSRISQWNAYSCPCYVVFTRTHLQDMPSTPFYRPFKIKKMNFPFPQSCVLFHYFLFHSLLSLVDVCESASIKVPVGFPKPLAISVHAHCCARLMRGHHFWCLLGDKGKLKVIKCCFWQS